jgi:hypothetical protein
MLLEKGKKKSGGAGAAGTAGAGGAVTAAGGVGGAVTAAGGAVTGAVLLLEVLELLLLEVEKPKWWWCQQLKKP